MILAVGQKIITSFLHLIHLALKFYRENMYRKITKMVYSH